MKKTSAKWIVRISLQLAVIAMTPNAFGNDQQDYMEYESLEKEAQTYEAETAPKVSFQEMPYVEEFEGKELEAEYEEYGH